MNGGAVAPDERGMARTYDRYGVARVVFERKPNAASPAPPAVLARPATADLVVTGSAD